MERVQRNVAFVLVDRHGVQVLLPKENQVKSRLTEITDVEPIRQLAEERAFLKIQRLNFEHLFIWLKFYLTYLDVKFVALQGWIEQEHDWLLQRRTHFLVDEQVAEVRDNEHANLVDVGRRDVHAQNLFLVVQLPVEFKHLHEVLLVKDVFSLLELRFRLRFFRFERHREAVRDVDNLGVYTAEQ